MSRKQDDIRVRNIPLNIERANKEYARRNRVTEAPDKIKKYHKDSFM